MAVSQAGRWTDVCCNMYVARHCSHRGRGGQILRVKRMVTFDSGQVHTEVLAEYSIKFDEKSEEELLVFSNAMWAIDLDSRHSMAEFILVLNVSVISWKFKKQPTVATSSTAADYMALYPATQEAVWLRLLLLGNRGCLSRRPTTIYQDNHGCIMLTKNPDLSRADQAYWHQVPLLA